MFDFIKQRASQARNVAVNASDWLRLSDDVVLAQQTPYEVIYREDIASLRYYPPLDDESIELMGETVSVEKKRYKIPVVLVSPLAVNMSIYDLFPQRSFVRFLRARGFEVYLVDWGKPTRRHNHWSLYHYFGDRLPRFIEQARAHSGSKKLSLHGWSFGGLFSYCYTALFQDTDIENLVMIGAPCDYHANGDLGKQYQKIAKQLHRLEDRTGWTVHRSHPRWWRIPGVGNAVGFKLTNPVGSAKGYIDLAKHLDDREYVINHATNASFVDRMEAYPGAVVQDFIQYLWTDNVLAKGQLPMADGDVAPNVSSIKTPLFAVAGKSDVIVNRDCLGRLLELVQSDDKSMIEVSGGHMGILGGSKAPEQSWKQVADWLGERSGGLVS
ncbi:polyhydroxyalkanoate synthase [gamma proteobacterium HTCC5015]|nr:polyhydroxyalkanoate synthase [gamma proteobacterium HTCC5015]